MQLDMTKGRPLPIILRFFVPIFLGNMFQQIYNMCDTIIVGQFVGQDAFAAVGSTGTIMFMILGFAMGLAIGFTVVTSQKFGAKDEAGVRQSVSNAIILSAFFAVIITAVAVYFMKPVLHLMNTPDDIYDLAYDYIIIIAWGTACNMFYNLFSAMLRAVGNSKVPLYFLIFSAVLNIFLDLLLIIVFKMGVSGAAIATVFSQGLSAVLSAVYIFVKTPVLRPQKGEWKLNRKMAARQIYIGGPMALQFGITASGTMIMQSAINRFGSEAIAGFTATSKVSNILTQAFPALGASMSTYVGQNYGKGDVERIKQGTRVANVIALVVALIGAGLGLILLKPAIPLFLGSKANVDALLPWAKTYMYASLIFYFPLGILFIYRNSMQGCGYSVFPLLGGVGELLARVVMAALSMHFNSYLLAVAGDPAAWVVTGVFDFVCWLWVIRDVEKKLKSRQVEYTQ